MNYSLIMQKLLKPITTKLLIDLKIYVALHMVDIYDSKTVSQGNFLGFFNIS